MNIKKINRNAFSEKIIHRYLFERYYFSDNRQREALLPQEYKGQVINLIVPENSSKEYRADLELYFKKQKIGVPVEVKWTASDFNKSNQRKYIEEKNGFLVTFKNSIKNFPEKSVVIIDKTDFSNWVSENISKLTRDALISQIDSLSGINKQYWLVFLRGGKDGSAHKNFMKMLDLSTNKPFWAFRQNRKALHHILNMQKGDKIIFMFSSVKDGSSAHTRNPNAIIDVSKYYICTITDPYYMALEGKKSIFFENVEGGTLEVNNRKWPHFVDFIIDKKQETQEILKFGRQYEYSEIFANSTNFGGGTPQPLTIDEYNKLYDKLQMLSSQSINLA